MPSETSRLAEVGEVLEREGEGDGFRELDLDVVVGFLNVGVGAKGDRTIANITVRSELDTFFRALDSNCAC